MSYQAPFPIPNQVEMEKKYQENKLTYIEKDLDYRHLLTSESKFKGFWGGLGALIVCFVCFVLFISFLPWSLLLLLNYDEKGKVKT